MSSSFIAGRRRQLYEACRDRELAQWNDLRAKNQIFRGFSWARGNAVRDIGGFAIYSKVTPIPNPE